MKIKYTPVVNICLWDNYDPYKNNNLLIKLIACTKMSIYILTEIFYK